MRTLYPTNGSKPGVLNKKQPDFVLTEQDYQALLSEISDIVEDLNRHKLSNIEFEEQLAQSIRSVTANFDNLSSSSANIASVIAHELTVAIANATTFTVDTLNVLVSSAIKAANIERLIADTATIDTATISTLTGTTATFDTINADEANLSLFSADNLASDNLTADNATIDSETVDESTITNAAITNAEIGTETVNNSTITALEAIKANIDTLNAEFQVHNELTNVQYLNDYSVTDDFYAVVPIVYNGSAYLTAVDSSTHEILWTVEILNSMQNNLIRWGINESGAYLKEFEIVQPDNNSEFIQIHGIIDGRSVELYHYTNSFNNVSTIDIYSYKKYTGFKTFEITRSQGSYVPNATFAGEFHAESLVIDQTEFESIKVDKAIILPDKVDQYGQVEHSTDGNPFDYLMVKEDEHGNEYPTWQKPTDKVEEDNKLLIDSDTVAKYDGEIDNPDYDPTDPTSEEFKYPIVNLGNNTTVHGNVKVECNTTLNEHLFIGTTADYANATLSNDAIVILTDEVGDCKVYRRRVDAELVVHLDPIAVMKSGETFDANGILVYDADDDTIKTSLDITVDSETINGNLHVKGDAYVDGTLHTVDEETITSVGDNIVLRANNPSSLGADYSGLIINNYDGLGNSLQVATDSDGTLKLGTGSVTVTTYNDIYYDPTPNKWYSDAELTTEVTPEGWLQSWSDIETLEGGVVHYEGANFAVLHATLEPIMTRDEDINLNDQGLLIWDATDTEAKTIDNPTASEQTLESVVTPGTTTTTTVYTDGTNFYGSDMTPTTEPSGTAGTPVSVGQFVYYDNVWFAYNNNTWYDSVDSWTDDTNWTEVVDAEVIAILDAQTKFDISQVTYTEVEDPTISYQWTTKKPGTYVFATIAAYEQYEIDHPGIIPIGSQVIIEANSNYIKSEDIE